MFFKTKRNRRKTTRQTLHTEQLEPKAMFSVSPVEPVVALDVGPVNQANVEDCMVIEPVFNVGEDGRRIVHPEYNVAGSANPGGDDIFMPKPNQGVSLHDSVHCLVGGIGKTPFTTGAGGESVVHPEFIVHPEFSSGVNSLAQANQQPQIASVWTNGNATSKAPRHAAFAMMGR
jgi:hypothetical protein